MSLMGLQINSRPTEYHVSVLLSAFHYRNCDIKFYRSQRDICFHRILYQYIIQTSHLLNTNTKIFRSKIYDMSRDPERWRGNFKPLSEGSARPEAKSICWDLGDVMGILWHPAGGKKWPFSDSAVSELAHRRSHPFLGRANLLRTLPQISSPWFS